MRPKRTDNKYWIGTRNFDHIQYESDIEDYIIDLENEIQQLRKHDVRLSLLNKVKQVVFGGGSAQERMVDIKALFSNEA